MQLSGQIHSPVALLPGKSPLYPLDRRLHGFQIRSGRGGDEKKSHYCPCLELNPGQVRSLVTVMPELSQLIFALEISLCAGLNTVHLEKS